MCSEKEGVALIVEYNITDAARIDPYISSSTEGRTAANVEPREHLMMMNVSNSVEDAR